MENQKENTIVKPEMGIVCVWPGTILPENQGPEDFEKWIKDEFDVRTQFLEIFLTKPDKNDHIGITGGRSDLFFAVHNEDIGKFAIKRLAYGIRWLEDATSDMNDYRSNPIYDSRILKYLEL